MKQEGEKYVLDIQLSSDKKWDYTLFRYAHNAGFDDQTTYDRMYEPCDEGVIGEVEEEEGLELDEVVVAICCQNRITDDDELFVCLRG